MVDIDWDFSEKQTEALDILDDPSVRSLLYGGAKGGGKSVLGCRWLFWDACQLIKRYGLKPRKYPIGISWMGRKQFSDFKDTTLETWKTEIPSDTYELKIQSKEIIIRNTVKIVFGGFDSREDIKKFNSAEYARFFVDQAEEVTQDEIGMLKATLRLKIDGNIPDYKELYTANPAPSWLKAEYIDKRVAGRRYLQALPSDNPYLPKSYIDTLKDSYRHRPEVLEAYLYGSWDVLAGHDIIIKDVWIRESHNRILHPPKTRRLIVCDPARYGDDETVIFYMENTRIIKFIIYGQKDIMYTANTIAVLANQHKYKGHPPLIVNDTAGLGGGVTDRLMEMGFQVMPINSAEKSTQPDVYYNLRTQMNWEAGRKFADGDIDLSYDEEDADWVRMMQELGRQLSSVKYTLRNGKILAEDKDEVKKRLARSPDHGDAYNMGLYGLQYVRADEDTKPLYDRDDRYNNSKRRRRQKDTTALSV